MGEQHGFITTSEGRLFVKSGIRYIRLVIILDWLGLYRRKYGLVGYT